MVEFLKEVPSIRFMALRRRWYAISAAVVVASIVLVMVRGLNLTVDFTGGLVFEIGSRSRSTSRTCARRSLPAASRTSRSAPTALQANSKCGCRRPRPGPPPTDARRVIDALAVIDPAVKLNRTESVGPQVSQQLGQQAALALLMTLLLVLIYIAFRFRWRFGIGSLVASLHDPIVAVGAIALLGIPFDLNVVAALLTILGYSVNDTVVIFDRIRERFKSMRKAEPAEVIDRAINETLARTIIVSGCALSSVIFLAVLGGETLRGFAVALAIGIVIGTYSSIYVAGAIALDLGASARDFMPPEKRGDVDDLP